MARQQLHEINLAAPSHHRTHTQGDAAANQPAGQPATTSRRSGCQYLPVELRKRQTLLFGRALAEHEGSAATRFTAKHVQRNNTRLLGSVIMHGARMRMATTTERTSRQLVQNSCSCCCCYYHDELLHRGLRGLTSQRQTATSQEALGLWSRHVAWNSRRNVRSTCRWNHVRKER